jgi:hypothetical protein
MCVSRRAKAAGLERSMMQRLMEAGSASPSFLRVQYRMHPAICAFPSRRFYDGRLLNAERVAASKAVAPWVHCLGPSALGPWAFIDVSSGREARGPGGSLSNRREAEAIAQVVVALRDKWGVHVDSPRALRILTFYAAQVGCIRRALCDAGVQSRVSIGTVDGSQGAESGVVLLSFVRSNTGSSIGFVEDWRRLNVAITRAQRTLLMFGSAATLGSGEVGEAASDLVRAAVAAASLFSEDGSRVESPSDALLPPHARERLLSVRHRRKAPTAERKTAAEASSQAAAAGALELAGTTATAGTGKRALERAPRSLGEPDTDDGAHERDEHYLRERAAEIASFVRSCKRADVEKAAKRQRDARAAMAPFAPPPLYEA